METFASEFPVQQTMEQKQQQLLPCMHIQKEKQACVVLWHKSSSVDLLSPYFLIPSATLSCLSPHSFNATGLLCNSVVISFHLYPRLSMPCFVFILHLCLLLLLL
ncbi:hypothetical protein AMECASPLE_013764 [Ameca splendens]|uniref:Uncharacterized protein n=1 Tax=Ameca splendens TaxID=208324 RepID=A0ABV0XQG7_9TELE